MDGFQYLATGLGESSILIRTLAGVFTKLAILDPLLWLSQRCLKHSQAARLRARCEFQFVFIELDKENKDQLDAEVSALGKLPKNVTVETSCDDCFGVLQSIVGDLKAQGNRMAPAFVFVDPYGFKIPGSLLREPMAAGRVELCVNFMWRYIDMAIRQGSNGNNGLATTMDALFDGSDWKDKIGASDAKTRALEAADLFAQTVGAKWSSAFRMEAANHSTKYMLLHLSNHPLGRKLMKDSMWAVCPDAGEGFYARDGNQQVLITPEPDFAPL